MIPAPVQFLASLQPADAPFDPHASVVPLPEPPVLFVGYALGQLGPGFGQNYFFHSRRGGNGGASAGLLWLALANNRRMSKGTKLMVVIDSAGVPVKDLWELVFPVEVKVGTSAESTYVVDL
jgi:hypothetical protein